MTIISTQPHSSRRPASSCYDFLPADFNLDGAVDYADFVILQANYTQCGKKFTDGDADGDGCVDLDDYSILLATLHQTGGNQNLAFDFDRDNDTDGRDMLTWQRNLGLPHCASRFEGDADGDGDVDQDDSKRVDWRRRRCAESSAETTS